MRWRKAASTRSLLRRSLAVVRVAWSIPAPLVLLYAFQWFAQRGEEMSGEMDQDHSQLRPLVLKPLYFGVFQTVTGLAIMSAAGLGTPAPFRADALPAFVVPAVPADNGWPVRTISAGEQGVPLASVIRGYQRACSIERQMFPATEHVELPNSLTRNTWLQTFAWIRQNTPTDALFALDPHYMELPGEDYHGFRALAERSALADYDKDAGMAARVPSLAPRWLKEVNATNGWKNFQAADFVRLKRDFGVTWVVLSQPPTDLSAMMCPYQHGDLSVCRLY